ncbi:MAG: hypothetical protein ACTSSH_11265, partial [Candidatus Heimdallarchaeota archaeon]
TDPEIITEISVGGRFYKLELDGSFVYFFEENGRMYALDISNINNIIIYENIYPNLDFYSPSFTVKDDYAYLLYSSQEMRVLSLHDLANVEVIGEIALGRTTDIFVDNNFAYITGFTLDWHSNLLMVNVTQPDNPVLYANYSLSGMPLLYSVKDFSVSDSIIYITDDEGLRIFESIDSNNLVFLSGYNTTDRGYFSILHVTVKDDCAYLTGPKVGLEVINVSDIYNPMKIGQFSDLCDNTYSAASIYQDFIYYVIDTGGLEIVGLDQDSDGLADYFETSLYSSNPLSNDTDNDMISDGYEVYIYHSNPTSLDSDLDTLSDTDEVFLFGTNPALSDTDHDLISDLDEILAGSDPLNPNDPNINYTITSYIGLAESLFFSISFAVMTIGVLLKKRRKK